jgi:hypothetical protein
MMMHITLVRGKDVMKLRRLTVVELRVGLCHHSVAVFLLLQLCQFLENALVVTAQQVELLVL